MGYRVAGIGGKNSDYDFFLREHIDSGSFNFVRPQVHATSLGNLQNTPFTRTQICKALYLVRRRSVSVAANFTRYGTGGGTYDVTASLKFDMCSEVFYDSEAMETTFVAIPDERYTVLHQRYQMIWVLGIEDPTVFFPNVSDYSVSDPGSISPELSLVLDFSIITYNGGNFYPAFDIDIGLGGTGNHAQTAHPVSGFTDAIGNFQIDGIDTTMWRTPPPGSPGTGDIVINSCEIDMSPVLYWEYATKAGLAVYDTSDGSVLRDPLS